MVLVLVLVLLGGAQIYRLTTKAALDSCMAWRQFGRIFRGALGGASGEIVGRMIISRQHMKARQLEAPATASLWVFSAFRRFAPRSVRYNERAVPACHIGFPNCWGERGRERES